MYQAQTIQKAKWSCSFHIWGDKFCISAPSSRSGWGCQRPKENFVCALLPTQSCCWLWGWPRDPWVTEPRDSDSPTATELCLQNYRLGEQILRGQDSFSLLSHEVWSSRLDQSITGLSVSLQRQKENYSNNTTAFFKNKKHSVYPPICFLLCLNHFKPNRASEQVVCLTQIPWRAVELRFRECQREPPENLPTGRRGRWETKLFPFSLARNISKHWEKI